MKRMKNWIAIIENTMKVYQLLKMELPSDPAIPLLDRDK